MQGQVIEQWVGHCQDGSSDKVWAGCATDAGEFHVVYGRRPMASQSGLKVFASGSAARAALRAKVAEKERKSYQAVPFDDPYYGVPSFGGSVTQVATPASPPQPAPPRLAISRVAPAGWEDLEACRDDGELGISEKVNGVRCVLENKDGGLVAYNRRGVPMATTPPCAVVLQKLGDGFCLDGEWVEAAHGEGAFVAFDIMDIGGEDVRKVGFADRMEQLRGVLRAARLVSGGGPTMRGAEASSLTPGFMLLIAQAGASVYDDVISHVVAEGREGVVVRRLSAPYIGESADLRKFKLTSDIDVIALAVGEAGGKRSVTMGLIRESDGAILEVGRVRSGLNDDQVDDIGALIASGVRPVLKVSYLGARTVGIKLVEARTSADWMRDDKTAAECVTSQLGPDRAALVEACEPYGRAGQAVRIV